MRSVSKPHVKMIQSQSRDVYQGSYDISFIYQAYAHGDANSSVLSTFAALVSRFGSQTARYTELGFLTLSRLLCMGYYR